MSEEFTQSTQRLVTLLGAGYMPAEHIRSAIMEIRERTEQAQQVLARYSRELGLTDTSTAPPSVNTADYAIQFDEQLQALLTTVAIK